MTGGDEGVIMTRRIVDAMNESEENMPYEMEPGLVCVINAVGRLLDELEKRCSEDGAKSMVLNFEDYAALAIEAEELDSVYNVYQASCPIGFKNRIEELSSLIRILNTTLDREKFEKAEKEFADNISEMKKDIEFLEKRLDKQRMDNIGED